MLYLGMFIGLLLAIIFVIVEFLINNDGVLHIMPGEEKDVYRFDIDDLEGMSKKKFLIIAVSREKNEVYYGGERQ